MKRVLFFLAILAAGIMQATLLNSLRIFHIKPDLLLALAVIAAFSFDLKWAAAFCVFSGVLKDALSGSYFGFNSALFFLWCLAIKRIEREIEIDNIFMRLGILFLVSLCQNILSGILLAYLGIGVSFGITLRIILFGSLYTTAVASLLFKASERSGLLR